MGLGKSTGDLAVLLYVSALDRINQSRIVAPATLHSGEGTEKSADPPQVMSPNVEENQTHEHTSVKPPSRSHNLGSKKKGKRM